MKKNKLHIEKFHEGQEIVIRIARKYKNGVWTSYAPDEDYIVYKVGADKISVSQKNNHHNIIDITDESIKTGVVRIVRVLHKSVINE